MRRGAGRGAGIMLLMASYATPRRGQANATYSAADGAGGVTNKNNSSTIHHLSHQIRRYSTKNVTNSWSIYAASALLMGLQFWWSPLDPK